jgi:hypothetical protein
MPTLPVKAWLATTFSRISSVPVFVFKMPVLAGDALSPLIVFRKSFRKPEFSMPVVNLGQAAVPNPQTLSAAAVPSALLGLAAVPPALRKPVADVGPAAPFSNLHAVCGSMTTPLAPAKILTPTSFPFVVLPVSLTKLPSGAVPSPTSIPASLPKTPVAPLPMRLPSPGPLPPMVTGRVDVPTESTRMPVVLPTP